MSSSLELWLGVSSLYLVLVGGRDFSCVAMLGFGAVGGPTLSFLCVVVVF